ncbi:MAG TPA: CPBP family intramembrane glutamic endopeptidase [Bacteroidales bacterium]|nr:CPBP family intramembrane glutamic endopeptidase [Bacteroidales bacterium]
MRESAGLFPLKSQSPSIQFLVSLIILTGVAAISLLIVIISARLIFGIGLNEINLESELLPERQIHYLKYVQVFQHISIFLIPSLIISWLMSGNIIAYQGMDRMPDFSIFFIVLLITIFIIPVTGATGILNSGLTLPDWLSGVEEWMIKKEHQANSITGWLIEAEGLWPLTINIIILALLPAFGEEFLFRGIIQQILTRWLNSGHAAVWITSIIFSTVHLQFYGFIPRLILGLIFGYLFLWSSTIWLPLFAHFINNVIPVIGSYLVGWDRLNKEMVDGGPDPGWLILIPAILVLLLMNVTRTLFREKYKE